MNEHPLSASEVAQFGERGIVHPVRALPAEEAAALNALYQAQAGFLKGRNNQKPHLLFPWLDAVVRDPRIVDAVESILGPNLFCWASQFFAKPAGDPAYVSWHQDATYWGLSSPDVATAWLALTPSTPESGCMRVVPGTHRAQVPHEDRFDDANRSLTDTSLTAGRLQAFMFPTVLLVLNLSNFNFTDGWRRTLLKHEYARTYAA